MPPSLPGLSDVPEQNASRALPDYFQAFRIFGEQPGGYQPLDTAPVHPDQLA